jgi:hypothetical protein
MSAIDLAFVSAYLENRRVEGLKAYRAVQDICLHFDSLLIVDVRSLHLTFCLLRHLQYT